MLLTFTTLTDIEVYRSYTTKPIHIPQGTFVAPDFWARKIQQLYPSTVLGGYPDYKPKPNEDYAGKRVLFMRLGGIGDMLFIMPAIRALKEHFPTCEIGMAVDSHVIDLVRDDEIAEWYTSEDMFEWAAKGRFNYVVSLHDVLSLGPRNIDVFDAIANYLGIATEWLDYKTHVNTRYDWLPNPIPEAENMVSALLDKSDFNVVVQVTTGSPIRTIPKETLSVFLKAIGLMEADRTIWFVGKPNEQQRLADTLLSLEGSEAFWSCFPFVSESPADLVALIHHADIVVTSDSASMHIAAALDKPCLAVFNAFAPAHYCSHYPTVVPIDIRSNCEFADNEYRKCFELGAKCSAMKKRGTEYAPCFDYLDVIDMMRKFEEMAKRIKK